MLSPYLSRCLPRYLHPVDTPWSDRLLPAMQSIPCASISIINFICLICSSSLSLSLSLSLALSLSFTHTHRLTLLSSTSGRHAQQHAVAPYHHLSTAHCDSNISHPSPCEFHSDFIGQAAAIVVVAAGPHLHVRAPTLRKREVLIDQGIPTILKYLLQKVRRWEFIELSELLPSANQSDNASTTSSPAPRFSLFPGCEIVRPKKRQIVSITDWVQAFLVYTTTLVSEYPEATVQLLAYMLTIIKASQQYDGLYGHSYDTNYRITAAASGNHDWSRLDTDLYTRFFTGHAKPMSACFICNSLSHAARDCPRHPALTVPVK